MVNGKNRPLDCIISLESLYEGLKDASKTKLETLVAEYPDLKTFIFRLKKKKVRLNSEELRLIWECNKKEAKIIINNLIKIGFLKNEIESELNPQFYIPIIFRPALNIQYN